MLDFHPVNRGLNPDGNGLSGTVLGSISEDKVIRIKFDRSGTIQRNFI